MPLKENDYSSLSQKCSIDVEKLPTAYNDEMRMQMPKVKWNNHNRSTEYMTAIPEIWNNIRVIF